METAKAREVQRMKTETRSYNFEIRAERNEEQKGVITGRPIVYESKTDLGFFDEIIAKGALEGCDLTDVRFLVNHDVSRIPLARSRNNNENSTMQLMPDDDGLAIRVNLDIENNTEARNLYSAIERGDISGMSFMFWLTEDDEEWDDINAEHPTRTIKHIQQVLEVSAVTFPAYDDTSIGTRDTRALESAQSALESARNRSLESDSKASELELWKAKNILLGGI